MTTVKLCLPDGSDVILTYTADRWSGSGYELYSTSSGPPDFSPTWQLELNFSPIGEIPRESAGEPYGDYGGGYEVKPVPSESSGEPNQSSGSSKSSGPSSSSASSLSGSSVSGSGSQDSSSHSSSE